MKLGMIKVFRYGKESRFIDLNWTNPPITLKASYV